jgi:hypothetical protein
MSSVAVLIVTYPPTQQDFSYLILPEIRGLQLNERIGAIDEDNYCAQLTRRRTGNWFSQQRKPSVVGP